MAQHAGFADFIQRARLAIIKSSEDEPGTSPGSIIRRYREGELLLLSKHIIQTLNTKPHRISFMDLVFCDLNEQPDISEAIWQIGYNGSTVEESTNLLNADPLQRSKIILELRRILEHICTTHTARNHFRGPATLQINNWTYHCEQHGDFTDAHGHESLCYEDETIYKATFIANIRL